MQSVEDSLFGDAKARLAAALKYKSQVASGKARPSIGADDQGGDRASGSTAGAATPAPGAPATAQGGAPARPDSSDKSDIERKFMEQVSLAAKPEEDAFLSAKAEQTKAREAAPAPAAPASPGTPKPPGTRLGGVATAAEYSKRREQVVSGTGSFDVMGNQVSGIDESDLGVRDPSRRGTRQERIDKQMARLRGDEAGAGAAAGDGAGPALRGGGVSEAGVVSWKEWCEREDIDVKALRAEEYNEAYARWQAETTRVEVVSASKEYNPTVTTWGVFPRPRNISEAYGGGRVIKPGEYEDEDAAKKRLERTRQLMQNYRVASGLVYDPADETKAWALFNEGMDIFRDGNLTEAAEKFEAAAALIPKRTEVGGRATLQQAICLDSMGREEQAQQLYQSLKGHPVAEVARQASRMLFGYKAMDHLKARSISYAASSKDWEGYFQRFASRDVSYVAVAPEEEEFDVLGVTAAIAVIALPLGLAAALIAGA
ncbi:unnamed protein product [Pedinophyceae sp. YPF-701]|nr:unnamed protein product [Pedinophyceae sp. YPF-701]